MRVEFSGGRVSRWRRGLWLAACAAAAMSSACLATRPNATSECPPNSEAHCGAECGRPDAAASDTHEGHCEAILSDLCRARCLEACGDHTPSLTKTIEAYESSLEHDCG